MVVRLLQVRTFERAVDALFALISAADRTDLARYAGAIPARLSLLADLAFHEYGGSVWTPSSYHWGVQRTHLHIKIEIEHGDDEKPEKLASEICRQVLKVYGVRSAEVSTIVQE